jgi:5-methylcytosine-specific restriction protein A
MTQPEQFYSLGDDDAVQRHIRTERERGKKLRKTPWWKTQIQSGVCHFCQKNVGADNLTMDHLVPLARKGKSTRGNVVPACQACNRNKNLTTPVETILDQIRDKDS